MDPITNVFFASKKSGIPKGSKLRYIAYCSDPCADVITDMFIKLKNDTVKSDWIPISHTCDTKIHKDERNFKKYRVFIKKASRQSSTRYLVDLVLVSSLSVSDIPEQYIPFPLE
ncbi:hypothetical protein MXB_1140 [Myxobolus squamalis]|nr:hypothetical protein MXB_1140 [Myxobolus squamalis]